MKLARISFLIALLTLTTASFAGNLRSSNVTLPGGTINPRETLEITSDKLVPNGTYKLMCSITDSTNKTDPVLIQLNSTPTMYATGWGGSSKIILNGTEVSSSSNPSVQLKLTQISNSLEVTNLTTGWYSSSLLSITNLDQDHPVTVSNCRAVAVETEDNNTPAIFTP